MFHIICLVMKQSLFCLKDASDQSDKDVVVDDVMSPNDVTTRNKPHGVGERRWVEEEGKKLCTH